MTGILQEVLSLYILSLYHTCFDQAIVNSYPRVRIGLGSTYPHGYRMHAIWLLFLSDMQYSETLDQRSYAFEIDIAVVR